MRRQFFGGKAREAENVCKTLTARVRVSLPPRSPQTQAPVLNPMLMRLRCNVASVLLAGRHDLWTSFRVAGEIAHRTSLLRRQFSVQIRGGPRNRLDVNHRGLEGTRETPVGYFDSHPPDYVA